MPSREFTFFCVTLGIGILGSRFPFVELVFPFILPLLILVSGWKWAGAFILITETLDAPFWVQRLPPIMALLQLASRVKNLGPDETKALVQNYTSQIPIQVTPGLAPYFPWIALAIGIGCFVFIGFSFYGFYQGLRRYIKTLMLIRGVVKRWHR